MSEIKFPITFKLHHWELLRAAHAGCQRLIECLYVDHRQERPGANTAPNDLWAIEINGCAAELALAKIISLHWKGKGHMGDPDLGNHIEARHTIYPNGKLVLQESDRTKLDHLFFLLTGVLNTWTAHGWITGWEGFQIARPTSMRSGTMPCVWQDQLHKSFDINNLRDYTQIPVTTVTCNINETESQ